VTLAVLVGGFSVAAYELNLQRIQFTRQADRQEASDDLLDRQRREMTQTEMARQREQAEHVNIEWVTFPGRADTEGTVTNNSRRPITKIAAGVAVPLPDGGTETHSAAGWQLYNDQSTFTTGPAASGVLPVITPGETAACSLTHGGDGEGARLLVRFYDDAGRRWQLDHYMHLEPAPDDGW
jgi:hypothetical protein